MSRLPVREHPQDARANGREHVLVRRLRALVVESSWQASEDAACAVAPPPSTHDEALEMSASGAIAPSEAQREMVDRVRVRKGRWISTQAASLRHRLTRFVVI